MCEDEGKAVPTVIKKRNAQGSKSKSLRNLKTPSGKAKTSTELKKKKKTQGGSNDNQANSIQREAGWGDREPAPRAEPQSGPALELTPMRCGGKESACQCRRRKRPGGFNPWVGTISWRRKWQPAPVFLPGESHGQRSLGGNSPLGGKEVARTERLHHTYT